MILIDSNVLVAASVGEHPHHPSSNLFLGTARDRLLVAAHSFSETYTNLTRPHPGYHVQPTVAMAQIDTMAKFVRTVQLDPGATLAAMRRFTMLGGVGPRLYDYLIGATGEAFGADTIVTWNVRHFVPLFPHLRIVTPAELAA